VSAGCSEEQRSPNNYLGNKNSVTFVSHVRQGPVGKRTEEQEGPSVLWDDRRVVNDSWIRDVVKKTGEINGKARRFYGAAGARSADASPRARIEF